MRENLRGVRWEHEAPIPGSTSIWTILTKKKTTVNTTRFVICSWFPNKQCHFKEVVVLYDNSTAPSPSNLNKISKGQLFEHHLTFKYSIWLNCVLRWHRGVRQPCYTRGVLKGTTMLSDIRCQLSVDALVPAWFNGNGLNGTDHPEESDALQRQTICAFWNMAAFTFHWAL